jgi:hypothetical protein
MPSVRMKGAVMRARAVIRWGAGKAGRACQCRTEPSPPGIGENVVVFQ